MAKVKVKDIDRGWKKIREQLLAADGAYTKVGVQEGETDEEGTDLVAVAAANEFGTRTKAKKGGARQVRIPERSFIRSTADDQRGKVEQMKEGILAKLAEGKSDIRTELSTLGKWMKAKIQNKIVQLRSPPNSPITIAKKGSDNPLVDKGQLQQSIRHVEVIP